MTHIKLRKVLAATAAVLALGGVAGCADGEGDRDNNPIENENNGGGDGENEDGEGEEGGDD